MNLLRNAIFGYLIILLVSFNLIAQTPFQEGVLRYKADTISRTQFNPPLFPTQTIVYKKGNALRIEIWRASQRDPTAITKDIYIRNKKGTFLFVESSKPTRAMPNIALFMSYEEEKQFKAEQALHGMEFYSVKRVLQKTTWLNLPAEKVLLKGNSNPELLEATITKAIDIPLGAFFNPVSKLPGTPLQFIVGERGWQIRLTATSLKAQHLADNLFEIGPNRKPMSMSQMEGSLSNFK